MENKQKTGKETFANAWKKVADLGKKTVDSTKRIIDQTKENIHEQQAKKYIVVTQKEFKLKSFQIPGIIRIEEDLSNRSFVQAPDAIGWIELHKGVQVLHLYSAAVKKCGIVFIPLAQRDNVYCQDNFDSKKYINANQFFGKATEEKLAELNHIAYSLGAKSCSIEIVEAETEGDSRQIKLRADDASRTAIDSSNANTNQKSGKTISHFEGHDMPVRPDLKWFAHDDNIKGLIDMRCNKAIKSNVLELKGSSSASISTSIACAIDEILKVKGNLSMEKQAIKEHSDRLIFEIEF